MLYALYIYIYVCVCVWYCEFGFILDSQLMSVCALSEIVCVYDMSMVSMVSVNEWNTHTRMIFLKPKKLS